MAGAVQWAFGSEIPDWTGDKLHPVQLRIITIALSLIALASSIYTARHPEVRPRLKIVLALGVLGPAGICLTTVGRLCRRRLGGELNRSRYAVEAVAHRSSDRR